MGKGQNSLPKVVLWPSHPQYITAHAHTLRNKYKEKIDNSIHSIIIKNTQKINWKRKTYKYGILI